MSPKWRNPKWRREWKSLRDKEPLLPGPLTLQKSRDNYEDNTARLSAVTRQLALAGIAIIWVFKTGTTLTVSIPSYLRIPTAFLVAALGADLLQYVFSASSWGFFELQMERKFQRETLDEGKKTFGAPNSINWLGNAMLIVKVAFLIVAYIFLITVLYQKLFLSTPAH